MYTILVNFFCYRHCVVHSEEGSHIITAYGRVHIPRGMSSIQCQSPMGSYTLKIFLSRKVMTKVSIILFFIGTF